ncbi:response regulator transcription factor [Allopusillimonas soli]|uniref:Response regulator transcription factor n=1 Tax=Allopusillimonas soli TaxID=659016 RepID=A0A853FAQ6_9BURK|nr:response regulator transcription factor [Allopusillimonas soli]NYT37183.1 response regulator transcription factor [Allopusillimonas soli]TEA74815.1 response regulator transcription factor [Allopusillimonas soli]
MLIASLEDDVAQGQLIQSVLEQAGHQCTLFTTAQAMLAALARTHSFELLILDWEMPDLSGLDVLRWVRTNLGQGMPVMFVTSRTREEDLVTGLQAGADDYMVKPIRTGELVARVSALQRRLAPASSMETSFSCAAYTIEPAQAVISLNGQAIELAPKEYELAVLFFRNPGRLFSRDVLSNNVWNREIPATSRTLDTHLSNIRRKLQLRPENGVRLVSSYALGYRLELLADTQEAMHS